MDQKTQQQHSVMQTCISLAEYVTGVGVSGIYVYTMSGHVDVGSMHIPSTILEGSRIDWDAVVLQSQKSGRTNLMLFWS